MGYCPIHESLNKANIIFQIYSVEFCFLTDFVTVSESEGDSKNFGNKRNTVMVPKSPLSSLSFSPFPRTMGNFLSVWALLSLFRASDIIAFPVQGLACQLVACRQFHPESESIALGLGHSSHLFRIPTHIPRWELLVVTSRSRNGYGLSWTRSSVRHWVNKILF